MAFHNVLFNPDISYGAIGGPAYNTTVLIFDNGYEQRNINWDIPLQTWEIGHIINNVAKLKYLLLFFRNRKGRGNTWLFKDWSDYTVDNASVAGYNEGTLLSLGGSTYQLQKTYEDTAAAEIRDILFVVPSTFILWNNTTQLVESVDFTLNYNTGVVTMLTGSSFNHFTCQFYYRVRFDTDAIKLRMDGPTFGEVQSLMVMEVRD